MNSIKILSLNVNGWSNNKNTYANIFRKEDPDVILLSEHGVGDENIRLFDYSVLQKNHTNSRYDGVAIGVRRGLRFRPLPEMEESFLAVELLTAAGPLVVSTGYQPPRRAYLPLHTLNSLFLRHSPVLFLGDLNARCRSSGYTTAFNGSGVGLENLIGRGTCVRVGPDFPTFVTARGTTKPDIVLTNAKLPFNMHVYPGPLTPSDHLPIMVKLSTGPIQVAIRPRRSLARADWCLYEEILKDTRPVEISNASPGKIDTELDRLMNRLNEADVRCIPRVSFRTLPAPVPTADYLEKQAEFSRLYHEIEVFGPSIGLAARIRRARTELNAIIVDETRRNWDSIISKLDLEADPKKFWDTVKRLRGVRSEGMSGVADSDGVIREEPVEKERIFRDHWKQVFSITEEENVDFDAFHEQQVCRFVRQEQHRVRPLDQCGDGRRGVLFDAVSLEEFRAVLEKMKQKAPGASGITREHLRRAPDAFLENLVEIMNSCLSAGYFPSSLKTSKMIFIKKPGQPASGVRSYRPISLLEVTGKIFERLLNNRLVQFLNQHKIISDKQHGFRSGRGTDTALAIITEVVAKAKAKNCLVDVVLRDVQKAFDKVWLKGLQYKILKLGLDGYLERILCDYVTNRRAFISIDNFDGVQFGLDAGVPQGGCLSPTLYSLYTNDVPDPTGPHSCYVQFADDITQIVTTNYSNPRAIAHYTAVEISNINKYETKWKIRTNIAKFKVIPIGRKKTAEVKVNNHIYQYSTKGKVLGLTITSSGYIEHINNRINLAASNLRSLFVLRDLSVANKKKIYSAIVRSTLTYPTIPIHIASRSISLKIQRIQNKAIYVISNTSRMEGRRLSDLHQEMNIVPINVVLHQRAGEIWNKIIDTISRGTLEQLIPDINLPYKAKFGSSLLRALENVHPIVT